MPFVLRRPRRVIVNPDVHRAAQCKTTCAGAVQATTATLWLAALTIAFTVTLGGLAGVEDCLKKEISPPPPRAPPPPSPSPPVPVCNNIFCRIGHGDGRCQPMCNTAACGYDGGDCKTPVSMVRPGAIGAAPSIVRAPTTISSRPTTTLNELLNSIASRSGAGAHGRALGYPAKVRRPASYAIAYDGSTIATTRMMTMRVGVGLSGTWRW